MKNLHKIHWNRYHLLVIVSLVTPFIICTYDIISGNLPFWFDPARDLLLGMKNIEKFSLLGPPAGIPGFFYGPYWIWFLSSGLLLSKDPRVVSFLVLTIPYFTIFPYVLYRFNPLINKYVVVILWLLFIISFRQYASSLWNPHLAPLFTLLFIYFLTYSEYSGKKYDYFKLFAAGCCLGFIANFHLSFGITQFMAAGIVLVFDLALIIISKTNKKMQKILQTVVGCMFFGLGVLTIFLPFILFELRHNFLQIKVALETMNSAFAVVGIIGLSKDQVSMSLLSVFTTILKLPFSFFWPLFLVSVLLGGISIMQRKLTIPNVKERRFFLILFVSLCSVLYIYLKNKNPIWSYHFISVEIPALLLIGIITTKIKYLRYILGAWTFWLSISLLINFYQSLQLNSLTLPFLVTKEYEVDLIVKDSKGNKYDVYAYNPAIYTYDYDYIFMWKTQKDIQKISGETFTYLIIPESSTAKYNDFINYKTPNKLYKTVNTWQIPDGTTILKREKKSI